MNTIFKEYIFPALILILVAALLIIAGQFFAQTSLAEGIRAAVANQPSEVSANATDFFSLLSGFAVSLIKQTLLIGLPAVATWNILKRTQKSG